MHFGFSYVGLIFIIMLTVPNLIWTKNRPQEYYKNENKILLIFEKTGEVLVTCTALVFSDFNVRLSAHLILLALSFVLMLLYEGYWIKYFRSLKTMKDLYSSFAGVPLAGATFPVCSFVLLGLYGENVLMVIAAVVFGIGHIGIHFNHRKEIQ